MLEHFTTSHHSENPSLHQPPQGEPLPPPATTGRTPATTARTPPTTSHHRENPSHHQPPQGEPLPPPSHHRENPSLHDSKWRAEGSSAEESRTEPGLIAAWLEVDHGHLGTHTIAAEIMAGGYLGWILAVEEDMLWCEQLRVQRRR
uniref:Uncharacterized protein n=1 Tax=Timema cristinae TaxID=61476 RepID=A0A7R9DFR4_TIMCR|nr:unnamed protein product [Timema cristinae]